MKKKLYSHIDIENKQTSITYVGGWWYWTDRWEKEGEIHYTQSQSSHLSSVKDQIKFRGGTVIWEWIEVRVKERSCHLLSNLLCLD